MSTSNQIANRSTTSFTAIFEAASNEYKTLTGQDLGTHPFGAALEDNGSPDAVLDIFRKQAQALDKCRKGDDKLMAWLTPMVHILITFSGTLGEGVGIVSIPSFYVQSYNIYFQAVFTRKNTLYWYRCSSRGQSPPTLFGVFSCSIQLRR
jgi:hypothetical protein